MERADGEMESRRIKNTKSNERKSEWKGESKGSKVE